MRTRLLMAACMLVASAGMAAAQSSNSTSNTNAASDGQATSSTRAMHSKYHQKATDSTTPAASSDAKAVRPKGSGPTSGR
jgi:hypothetical protein